MTEKLELLVCKNIKSLRDIVEIDRFGNVVISRPAFEKLTEELLKATMGEYPVERGGCTYNGKCIHQAIVTPLSEKQSTGEKR
jgi:hypothetical protein